MDSYSDVYSKDFHFESMKYNESTLKRQRLTLRDANVMPARQKSITKRVRCSGERTLNFSMFF